MSCIIWGCSNNNPSTADPSVHHYVFPKHPLIAQQWITASGWPPEEIDINVARICSIHFNEDSYTTEVKMIEYMTCYTKVLKYDAVPTLYLPLTTQIVIKDSDPHEELREMIVFASEPDSAPEPKKPPVEPAIPEHDLEKYKHVQTKEQLEALENCNRSIRQNISKLEDNLKSLKESLTNQMEYYKAKDVELSNLHQEYLRSKRAYLSLQEQKALLSKVFSESQIKILSGRKKIYWSNDDMAVGYTIRHLSNKRCYVYLTKKLNIPLPAVSSIKRWMTLKGKGRKGVDNASFKKAEAEAEDEDSD
ncbi:hypothetical protein Zmor_028020 [Zophobas morio]|uniref:THAP-type domain-containing protein n=1 Tax=Zophobas morio TaxID=2755281 RepID=A0AA38HPL2_9CUCU|nr:hypothetical protein Zmor_028020 [Zophobas morio]